MRQAKVDGGDGPEGALNDGGEGELSKLRRGSRNDDAAMESGVSTLQFELGE